MTNQRYIPHSHTCPVCMFHDGCSISTCKIPDFAVCVKEECKAAWATRTIHAHPGDNPTALSILPCCGVRMGATKPGDVYTSNPSEVNCPGDVAAQAASAAMPSREDMQATIASLRAQLAEALKPKAKPARKSNKPRPRTEFAQ